METYESRLNIRLDAWERDVLRPAGLLERTSKKVRERINALIPQKVHDAITAAVRTIVRTSLFGAEYTPRRSVEHLDLPLSDETAEKLISTYQKVAAAEGAGTGAGGFMLALADFPALIAIKMKLLFELAHVYGYDTKDFSERIFLLKVFQFTYTSPARRKTLLIELKNWPNERARWSRDQEFYASMDWEDFQKEYRDAIDFKKMLQFIPGLGAVAGAWANYSIVEELGENAMNLYRIRRRIDELSH
ncbi:EcsC family protein [Gorillibacterium sp. sgz5001074]|uniref:EcsC family protein n=1 Tax=Gorillibacterium sp. sgz5001074 TaxID=3446695 RepID=UPI003F6714B1